MPEMKLDSFVSWDEAASVSRNSMSSDEKDVAMTVYHGAGIPMAKVRRFLSSAFLPCSVFFSFAPPIPLSLYLSLSLCFSFSLCVRGAGLCAS